MRDWDKRTMTLDKREKRKVFCFHWRRQRSMSKEIGFQRNLNEKWDMERKWFIYNLLTETFCVDFSLSLYFTCTDSDVLIITLKERNRRAMRSRGRLGSLLVQLIGSDYWYKLSACLLQFYISVGDSNLVYMINISNWYG